MHELLAPLNSQQQKAAAATDGPVLILAGAGSGKTKTLIHRIAYLIASGKAKPYNILAVTFTNKAAKEMKSRLQRLLLGKVQHWPVMGTFHSVCVQILRREIPTLGYNSRFVIYDDADSINLVKKVMKDLRIDTKAVSPTGIRYLISKVKNELYEPAQYESEAADTLERTAAQVYAQYQAELKRNNALDFDDLIRLTVKIFRDFPEVLQKYQTTFKYILVDEYQDTNHAQYILVNLLAKVHNNICVVGDDFQSIYSWRGANLQNILDFEEEYPKATVVLLEQNYRSTKTILNAANEIIKYNVKQKAKTLWTENDTGHKIIVKAVADEKAEGDFIIREIFGETDTNALPDAAIQYIDEEIDQLNDDAAETATESLLDRIMQSRTFQGYQADQRLLERIKRAVRQKDLTRYVVLYRTNAQSRALEEMFIKYRVPYKIIGGFKFYERKEIKDFIAYLRVVANPNDWVSLERIINVPARGIGQNSWHKIEGACRDHSVSMLEVTAEQLPVLRATSREAFVRFQKLLQDIVIKSAQLTPSEIVELVLRRTGYKEQFNTKLPEDMSRLENIEELKSVTKGYDNKIGSEGLHAFLEEITLVSDQDDVDDSNNAVNLMTIHAAKGLEFDTVFICGMEDGLFPHSRSLFQPAEMEEERRLCYVALTRAKRRAYFIYAEQRTVYGSTQITAPSRFLNDLPKELTVRS